MEKVFFDIKKLEDTWNWMVDQVNFHQKGMKDGVNREFNRGARYAFDSMVWRIGDMLCEAGKASMQEEEGTVRDVREALGLSGGEGESTEGMTARQLDIFTGMVQDLQKMASGNSVNESISEGARAAYTAKEDAFATVLLTLKTCRANKL